MVALGPLPTRGDERGRVHRPKSVRVHHLETRHRCQTARHHNRGPSIKHRSACRHLRPGLLPSPAVMRDKLPSQPDTFRRTVVFGPATAGLPTRPTSTVIAEMTAIDSISKPPVPCHHCTWRSPSLPAFSQLSWQVYQNPSTNPEVLDTSFGRVVFSQGFGRLKSGRF